MAKILFNDELFNISEAALNAASERIMRVLSSVMNGTGATINFGGTNYSIDSTKLSTATNSFVSHLGTVSGNGYKVVVGGVEYNVDSSKMSNAVSQIHAVLSGLQSGDSSLVMNEYGFYFDVPYVLRAEEEEGVTEISITFFADNSAKSSVIFNEEILVEASGACLYELNKITIIDEDGTAQYWSVADNGTKLVAEDGTTFILEADIGGGDSGLNQYGFYFNKPYSCHDDALATTFTWTFYPDGSGTYHVMPDNSAAYDVDYPTGDLIYSQNKIEIVGLDSTINFFDNGTKFDMGGYVFELESNSDSGIYDDEFPIEWNTMAVANNPSFSVEGMRMVKISNLILSAEEFMSVSSTANVEGETVVFPCYGANEMEGIVVGACGEFFFISASIAREIAELGVTIPEAGFYATDMTTMGGIDADCKLAVLPTPDAPEAPTAASVSENSITLNAIDGCEYSMDNYSWQDSPTFDNLEIGKGYTFYIRYKMTESSLSSQSSYSKIYTTGYSDMYIGNGNYAEICPSSVTDGELVIPATFLNPQEDKWYKIIGIGTTAFYENANLTSVVIPDSVIRIGERAFKGCSGLTSVTILGNTISIENSAFQDCTNLTSVTMSSGAISIDYQAFDGCSSLTDIVIPNGVTSINNHVFLDCVNLQGVVIPSSVTSIGYGAFSECTKLTNITFDGTISQWNAIDLNEYWGRGVPATQVVCSDGTVNL